MCQPRSLFDHFNNAAYFAIVKPNRFPRMNIIKNFGNGHPHHCRSNELTVTVPVGSTKLIPWASGDLTILSAWRGKVQRP